MVGEFDRLLREGRDVPFQGWDYPPMRRRWEVGSPPWDYRRLARKRIAEVTDLVDLGTGDGELLASLAPLPPGALATEGHLPNLRRAVKRLSALPVRLIPAPAGHRIPLPANHVDLVLSYQTPFNPVEVRRVLRERGSLLTQQIGSANYPEINEQLGIAGGAPGNGVATAASFRGELESAGLRVRSCREARYPERVTDVGALLYYLKAVPWQVPQFAVTRFTDQLRSIHEEIERSGGFPVTAHRLLAVAEK